MGTGAVGAPPGAPGTWPHRTQLDRTPSPHKAAPQVGSGRGNVLRLGVVPDALPELAPAELPDAVPEAEPDAVADPVPDELPEADPDVVPEAPPDPLPDEVPGLPEEALRSLDPQPTISPRVSADATRTSSDLAFPYWHMLSSTEHVACRES